MHLGSLNYLSIRMQTLPSLSSLGTILFFLAFLSVLTSSACRNFKREGLDRKSLDNWAPGSGERAPSYRRLWGSGSEAPSRWRKFAIWGRNTAVFVRSLIDFW